MKKAHITLACLVVAAGFTVPLSAQTSRTKTKAKAKQTVPEKVKARQSLPIARARKIVKHRIGDRVQVYYQQWYPATIREVGKGDYRGFYRVAFDEFKRQRWVDDDEIRAIPKGATHPVAFLSGDYVCYRRVRPNKAKIVDELYLEADGDYHMRDDIRVGRVMLGEDDKIIWEGGALDDADSHVDGAGMLHIVRTRHEHWTDSNPQQMQCVLK